MTFAYALSLFEPDDRFEPTLEFRRMAARAGLRITRFANRSKVAQWALALNWGEKSTIIVNGRSIEVFEAGQGYWRAFYVSEG